MIMLVALSTKSWWAHHKEEATWVHTKAVMSGSEVLVEFSAAISILVTRVGVTIVGTIVVGVRVTGARVDRAAVGLFVRDLGPGSITNTFEAVYGAV